MKYNGIEAVGLGISMADGHDITKVGKNVEKQVETIKTALPLGINFHKVFFQSDKVNDAIFTFLLNLLESVLIVVVLLMFSMGFRSGVILGINLVIIILGSFWVLGMFDGELQRVSLGALILAMGMLVDNAIVIIDGILIDNKKGIPKPDVLTDTAKRTAMPLLGATLIAILAFFPIFLSPDMAGVYVRDLFIVLAVSLLISWILALTLVPLQSSRLLKKEKNTIIRNQDDVFNTKFHIKYRRILTFFLKNKIITISCAIILISIATFAYKYINKGFFPDFKYEQAYIEYKLPENTNTKKVLSDLQTIENLLATKDYIKNITTSYGGTPCRYNLVRSFNEPSLAYGELIIDFESPRTLNKEFHNLQKELTELFPQAYVRIKKYNLMYRPYPIEILFTGDNVDTLKKLAAQAESVLNAEQKVILVRNDWDTKMPVMTVNYEQNLAREAGASRSDVAMSLLAATDGVPIGKYYSGDNRQDFYLRMVNTSGKKIQNLENIPLITVIPNLSPLNKETVTQVFMGTKTFSAVLSEVLKPALVSDVSDGISVKWENLTMRRYNGKHSIKVQCNNAPGCTPVDAKVALQAKIDTIKLPAGYKLEWLGEAKASADSSKYLFANIPLALVLMLVILIMLFKDWKKPLIIFLCIPLAVIGVVAGFLISGKDFSFVAMVGTLGLIGMMIKNGVVLLDEVTNLINNGKNPPDALLLASSSRLRPVLLASGTTIIGMIPLLGDVLFGALAVTIMGGLTIGTIVTLVMIPVYYASFFKIKM
jgi:multidrug efflux pump subunit AcrB